MPNRRNKKIRIYVIFANILLLAGCSRGASSSPRPPSSDQTVYGFEMLRLEGGSEKLEKYRGKVLLIVNTASECGLTPQYRGLEELHQNYADRGFTVLGFPANDFLGQEPATNAEIAEFVRDEYGVTFPMFGKSVVSGGEANPLFKFLAARSEAPSWNFHKYLIGRNGRLLRSFSSRTLPSDPTIVEQIERALVTPMP